MSYEGLDQEKHKNFLLEALLGIVNITGDKIAFKGGTAAMLFYSLPRFSRDLDFDILQDFSEREKEQIRALIQDLGEIRDFKDKRYTLFYLLDYEKHAVNLKIELNRRIWENNNYKTVELEGKSLKIQDETTMFTNKLVALSDRKGVAARDLFDINYFLKQGFPLSEELVRERTGESLKSLIETTVEFIEDNFNERNVLQGLGELLSNSQKDWVKENLIEDTIKKLKQREEEL